MAICEMREVRFSASCKGAVDSFCPAAPHVCTHGCRSAAGPAVPDVISGVFPHDLSCLQPLWRGCSDELCCVPSCTLALGSRICFVFWTFGGEAIAELLPALFDTSPNSNSSASNCEKNKKKQTTNILKGCFTN